MISDSRGLSIGQATPWGSWLRSRLRGEWELATGNFNGKQTEMIDSSNRFCPLTAVAVFQRESTCLWIISFFPGTFWQLASLVPCTKDELTRPLRGHPFRNGMTLTAICASFGFASLLQMAFESSTRKGGDRLSIFPFFLMCALYG